MTIVDITHYLYYANVLNPTLWDPKMLVLLRNEAIENVQKEHMTTFHKRLLICDPTLCIEFLQQVQVHYNMILF